MASNGRVGRPGPADDTNSDLGPQYLGAPRDESAPGPEPGVEGAAADGGRLDRARRRARRRVGVATRIYQGLREDAGWPGRARRGHPAAELRKSKTWCQVAERSAVIRLNGLGRWASGQRGRTDEEANIPADGHGCNASE